MKTYIIIILFLLILFASYFTKPQVLKIEGLNFCNGCIDIYNKCHPGTVPTRGCSANDLSTCYSFYDENGNLHSPCGLLDKTSDQEKSCNTCKNCLYCKKINKKENKCLPKIIFQIGGKEICDECPLNDQCLPGSNYII